MSHWTINGVPCCQSEWTGSKLSPAAPAFKCACSFTEFETMTKKLMAIWPEEDLVCTYQDGASCPGEGYWENLQFEKRVSALNEWIAGIEETTIKWSVDVSRSSHEHFVLTGHEAVSVHVVFSPVEGWVVLLSDQTGFLPPPPDLSAVEVH
jgi:hypothetical protein